VARALTIAWAVLVTVAVNGLIAARVFVPFPLHTALGWVMVGLAGALLAGGAVLIARQRAGPTEPRIRVGEWALVTALTAGVGVGMLALAPVLGW
jgi:hypothetical protein